MENGSSNTDCNVSSEMIVIPAEITVKRCTSSESDHIAIEDDMEDDEGLLIPLPNVSELKLKKFAASKILAKTKSRIQRKICDRRISYKNGETKRVEEISPEKSNKNEKQEEIQQPQPSTSSASLQSSCPLKTIIYPDKNKVLELQAKEKKNDAEQLSYNKVFTMSIERRRKANAVTPSDSVPKNTNNEGEEEKVDDQFRYKIPQNLLSSADDKIKETRHDSNRSDDSESEAIFKTLSEKLHTELKSRKRRFIDESEEGHDDDQFQMTSRPTTNSDLIDILAEYRAISLYLFKKLDIEPLNFDSNDDYIKMYKLSRK